VVPGLYAAGWTDDQIHEQRTFTDGRIMVAGRKVWRGRSKRADYLLRYRPSLMLAVVEAKAAHKTPGDGLQQAREYVQMLADPDFDGDPIEPPTETPIDQPIELSEASEPPAPAEVPGPAELHDGPVIVDPPGPVLRK